jgi:hypothetical protein
MDTRRLMIETLRVGAAAALWIGVPAVGGFLLIAALYWAAGVIPHTLD